MIVGHKGPVCQHPITNEVSLGTETENDAASLRNSTIHDVQTGAAKDADNADLNFLVKLEKEMGSEFVAEDVPKTSSELEINGVEPAKIG